MRPMLRQWRGVLAGRERAAPHIKTYGRFVKYDIEEKSSFKRTENQIPETNINASGTTPNPLLTDTNENNPPTHNLEKATLPTNHFIYSLDWYLLSSANLSKPAWGTLSSHGQQTRIQSYEAGVLLTPSLYGPNTVLMPLWKSNLPSQEQVRWAEERGFERIVGVRMAWDLPLEKYGEGDVPWVKNRGYEGRDWLGNQWAV